MTVKTGRAAHFHEMNSKLLMFIYYHLIKIVKFIKIILHIAAAKLKLNNQCPLLITARIDSL